MKAGRGYSRVEIPVALVNSLKRRYVSLAREHVARFGFENLEGMLLSVYMQGVADAAESLARSGALVSWPEER